MSGGGELQQTEESSETTTASTTSTTAASTAVCGSQPKQQLQPCSSSPPNSSNLLLLNNNNINTNGNNNNTSCKQQQQPQDKDLLETQPEKPSHYSYLRDFRVEQCPNFLQHKCTQHKPYTCFRWHFQNQRRRRPVRRRDGTFNYSPDVYCTKYDETTGVCEDGDDCPFLHRTSGDTERRYHLRYYKTGICVYDTDSRGYCVKNGQHCAFAHGVHDLRNPVYDIRELQAMEAGTGDGGDGNGGTLNGPNPLDKERNALNEDPRWTDHAYVLANYKTELCKKPPRLCRQGYACPQFHNAKDKRRPPKKHKYRSTPCPNVKQGDEWGDPTNCESGDACQYCHTRTEQQFHPEIYKSTKCNDVLQTHYCPRGPFCAFAHGDKEMQLRHELMNMDTEHVELKNFIPSSLANGPVSSAGGSNPSIAGGHGSTAQPQPLLSRAMSCSSGTSHGNRPVAASLHIASSLDDRLAALHSGSHGSSSNHSSALLQHQQQQLEHIHKQQHQAATNAFGGGMSTGVEDLLSPLSSNTHDLGAIGTRPRSFSQSHATSSNLSTSMEAYLSRMITKGVGVSHSSTASTINMSRDLQSQHASEPSSRGIDIAFQSASTIGHRRLSGAFDASSPSTGGLFQPSSTSSMTARSLLPAGGGGDTSCLLSRSTASNEQIVGSFVGSVVGDIGDLHLEDLNTSFDMGLAGLVAGRNAAPLVNGNDALIEHHHPNEQDNRHNNLSGAQNSLLEMSLSRSRQVNSSLPVNIPPGNSSSRQLVGSLVESRNLHLEDLDVGGFVASRGRSTTMPPLVNGNDALLDHHAHPNEQGTSPLFGMEMDSSNKSVSLNSSSLHSSHSIFSSFEGPDQNTVIPANVNQSAAPLISSIFPSTNISTKMPPSEAHHQQMTSSVSQQQQKQTCSSSPPSNTTNVDNNGNNSKQLQDLETQTEKPSHYSYLRDFRVEQCPNFLQHKCTQHKPYTCFRWHFQNQRRRRPVRKRDGTFNYSPDVYCTKYDETTGICEDGDDCPFLHRTSGDTERRYHLRYYKTGICVYDTDSRGYCVKNGQHCAFAHGVHDLRNPVYDIRELQAMEAGTGDGGEGNGGTLNGPNPLDKERNALNEDPRWTDHAYVLANYKTELCKKPPRLCRQGYACPQFHNAKDKRRPPKKHKYRSTPCPNVKQGDEWGDPTNCESGDACQYCHTRTEQQFHPEIYKSTKCNDVLQTHYCPRGPFCAFAHGDKEMQLRHELMNMDTEHVELKNFIPSTLANGPMSSAGGSNPSIAGGHGSTAQPQPLLSRAMSCSSGTSHGSRPVLSSTLIASSLDERFSSALHGSHAPHPSPANTASLLQRYHELQQQQQQLQEQLQQRLQRQQLPHQTTTGPPPGIADNSFSLFGNSDLGAIGTRPRSFSQSHATTSNLSSSLEQYISRMLSADSQQMPGLVRDNSQHQAAAAEHNSRGVDIPFGSAALVHRRLSGAYDASSPSAEGHLYQQPSSATARSLLSDNLRTGSSSQASEDILTQQIVGSLVGSVMGSDVGDLHLEDLM